MEKDFKKKILSLGIICLVLLGMFLTLSFFGQRKTTQKGAFGTGATLRLVPDAASHAINQEFWVEVRMDTTEKITLYRLALAYDKTKVAIVPVGDAKFEVGPKFGYINGFSDDENGTLLLRSGYVIPASGQTNPSDLPTGDNVLLAKFKVKGLVSGTTSLAFQEPTIVNGYNPGNDDVAITIATKTPVNLIFAGSGGNEIGTVNVSLDPTTITRAVNQTFDVDLKVDVGTQKVNFMKLGLNFDKDKMEIVSFTPGSWATADMFGPEFQDFSLATGTATLYAATMKTNLPTGVFTAGTVTLKGKANGTAALTIDKTRSRFGGEKGTQVGEFSVDQTTNGSYTIGAGGSGSVTLNFKVKFQGVNARRSDQKVLVKVVKGDTKIEIPNVNVSPDDNGIYSGTTSFDASAGSGYTVFIKGPKHLAKKFCSDNQTARCNTATGAITLANGANTFDFSKMALEPGDLPDPNNDGEQDGVVNSVDVSLIVSRVTKNTAANIAVADVNFDGVLQWDDVTLVLNTLETKYEEDY